MQKIFFTIDKIKKHRKCPALDWLLRKPASSVPHPENDEVERALGVERPVPRVDGVNRGEGIGSAQDVSYLRTQREQLELGTCDYFNLFWYITKIDTFCIFF